MIFGVGVLFVHTAQHPQLRAVVMGWQGGAANLKNLFVFFFFLFPFWAVFGAFTVHMRLSNLGNLILLIFQLYILLQKFNATVNITHPYLSFSILTRKPEISFKPKLGSSKYSMFLTNQTVEAWCMITLLCAICFWWQEVYISVGNCVAELQKLERKRTSSHRILLDYRDGKTRGRCGRVRAIFFLGCANLLAVYVQTS